MNLQVACSTCNSDENEECQPADVVCGAYGVVEGVSLTLRDHRTVTAADVGSDLRELRLLFPHNVYSPCTCMTYEMTAKPLLACPIENN